MRIDGKHLPLHREQRGVPYKEPDYLDDLPKWADYRNIIEPFRVYQHTPMTQGDSRNNETNPPNPVS